MNFLQIMKIIWLRLINFKLINNVHIESKKGFTYSIELLVKARRLNFLIAEIPAQWEERSNGKGCTSER